MRPEQQSYQLDTSPQLTKKSDEHLAEAAKLGDSDGTCYAVMALALEVRALRFALFGSSGNAYKGLPDLLGAVDQLRKR